MSADALSGKQFSTEQHILRQGNMDELRTRVAGYQNLTANVFRPSFSSDYTTVHSMQSPASAQALSGDDDE